MTGSPDKKIPLAGVRRYGVFLHITSLPSPYGSGDLGRTAKQFINLLADNGATIWQVLPLSATSERDHHCPYAPTSAFALDPKYLDLEPLLDNQMVTSDDIKQSMIKHQNEPGLERCQRIKRDMICLAYDRMMSIPLHNNQTEAFTATLVEYLDWKSKQRWLEDYAIFTVLTDILNWNPLFDEWQDEAVKSRCPDTLKKITALHAHVIDQICFGQFLLFRQCRVLLEYARSKGVLMMGDIPIYISRSSADVWAANHLFEYDPITHKPLFVSGVPPDFFSATGQLWGTPLPRWDVMKKDNFAWCRERFRITFRLFDAVRIDHFRALASYYKIPSSHTNAMLGHWEQGPRQELCDALFEVCDKGQLVVEDLGGEHCQDVCELRDSNGLKSMTVLQFGFGDNEKIHVPHRYVPNKISYTSTHDTDTIVGWWRSLTPRTKQRFVDYTDLQPNQSVADKAVRLCLSSVAETVIVPVTDILGLGSEARMNVPSTIGTNWTWQLSATQWTDLNRSFGQIKYYSRLFDRVPPQTIA